MQLLLIGPLHSMQFFHGQVLRAMGRPQWQFRLLLMHTIINVALYLILVRHGLVIIISAYVARAYLLLPIEVRITQSLIPLPLGEYASRLWPQFVASLAMVAWIFTMKVTFAANCPPVLILGSSLVTGAVVYLVCMALLRPALLREFSALAQILRSISSTCI